MAPVASAAYDSSPASSRSRRNGASQEASRALRCSWTRSAALSCADAGILGPVTGMIGSLAALEAIRAVAPFGEDAAGTLLIADLLAARYRTLRLPKDPGCRACGPSSLAVTD